MNRILPALVATLFFLSSSSALFAVGPYKAGDKLYVLAQNGLAFREKPDPNAAKISTLKNGSPLIVQAADLKKHAYTVTEFKGYTIKGFWVKVKTWDNKEGYVFDGYLSKYQAPEKVILDEHVDGQFTLPEQYMMVHVKRKGKKINLPKGETRYDHYKQQYVNGAEVEVNTGEGGSQYTIQFEKGITPEEAYLIARDLWFEKSEKLTFTYEKGVISILNEMESMAAEIRVKPGFTLLTLSRAD